MADLSVELKKVIKAPVAKVYDAWTDPDKMKQWHTPDGMSTPEAISDAVTGGKYRIKMVEPDGSAHVVAGIYKEVVPERKVVMSWSWQEGGGPGETLVTVWFKSLDERTTEVRLLHEHFQSEQSLQAHKAGWDSVLPKLIQLVETNGSGSEAMR
jgi:uncharacterized protein YndB with AHSA1/START domain